jgi:hypothetical protein
MSAGSAASATWPADVIHVNEDGWVLINRGSQHGITVGLGLLVVGQGVHELRNLFASEGEDGIDTPHRLKPDGFSVQRRSLRHDSPKGLPSPFYVPGGILVAVEEQATARADMRPHAQGLLDPFGTARAVR